MTVVFVLPHVAREGSDSEDIKLVGVFSTESAAREAILRLKHQPGFADYPDSFHIDQYELDRGLWVEGFGLEWIVIVPFCLRQTVMIRVSTDPPPGD